MWTRLSKMESMKLLPLFLASFALLLSSCLEDSTVIKVNKDGSGLVHHRQYSRNYTEEDDVKLPTQEKVEAIAKTMGPDVTVSSLKKAHNPQGWYGYEVVYEFPDINQVTVRPKAPKKDSSDGEDEPEEGIDALALTFQMKDGVLETSFSQPDWDNPATAETSKVAQRGPTIDPYAQASKQPAQKVSITSGVTNEAEMMKAMSKGMRIGIFLQAGDPLKSTTALQQDGELITLMNADMEKIYEKDEPDFGAFNGKTREETQQLVETIDGLDIDLQNPIRFEFE